jgi:predicted P-loop ATPase
MSSNISIFNKSNHTKNGKEIPFDVFLQYIQDGKWQDHVLPIRAMKVKEERTAAKKTVPYVTVSGTFSERKISGLTKHSGFVAIDVDDVDPEEVKSIVCVDRHVYAAFTSISGRGLCIVFRINAEKHAEAFEGLQEYLYINYGVVIDPSGKDVSRPRFISYDPHLYLNVNADKFTSYPKKKKAITKIPDVVFVQDDFDEIVKTIASRSIDITGGYHQWLGISYGIADKFGAAGRQYFHTISQFSPLYEYKKADKQYSACLKNSASSKRATIATIYYYAKKAGINVVSERTRTVTQTAAMAKKGRRTKEDTAKLLSEVEGIQNVDDIINQVFENNIPISTEDNPIEALELWIRQNYELKRNIVTRKIENYGADMEEEDLNSVFISAKKTFGKEVTSEIVNKLIFSRFILDYNPFSDFFEKHSELKPTGCIDKLFGSIQTDTGMRGSEFFPEYAAYFGRKWLVGMISAMHGKHSPLMLVLSGNKQGTGKTEFWIRFLPQELKKYFAESKLTRGKDDEILMSQKILILDDEMSSKDEKEISAFKRLTSKQVFSLRAPYGKSNIDLRRLAVLCGTTQENEILSDPSGNRRIIPINVLSIDHEQYNSVDKISLLMEAYWLYKEGFQWELTSDDIRTLAANTGYFEKPSAEYELLLKYFEVPEKENDARADFLQTTEIKSIIERQSGQKISEKKLGMELRRIAGERKNKREGAYIKHGYYIIEIAKKWAMNVPDVPDVVRKIF